MPHACCQQLPTARAALTAAPPPPSLLLANGHPTCRRTAGELLVTKDGVSYFLGPDGKPSRKVTLAWSGQPAALAATRMYAAALLPGGVEVRSVSRLAATTTEQVRALAAHDAAAAA